MRKLFGTDGIRAVAGEAPLDAKTIYAVGLALAHQLYVALQAQGGGLDGTQSLIRALASLSAINWDQR